MSYTGGIRETEVDRELAPVQDALNSDLTHARWAEAMAKLDFLEKRWIDEVGRPRIEYPQVRAEILIGLDQPEKALAVLHQGAPGMRAQWTLTSGLAGAMLGQFDEQGALAMKARIMEEYEGYPLIQVPDVKTRRGRLAMVRLARAVERSSATDDVVAEREARACLAIVPDQPLAALIVAESLRLRRKGAEAVPFYKLASNLPDRLGKEAAAMMKAYGG